MIGDYLNQSVRLEKLLSTTTAYGDKQYATPVSIKARKRHTATVQTYAHGELHDVKNIIHTDTEVAVGDKIDGEEVMQVGEYVNYAGVCIGWVVYT